MILCIGVLRLCWLLGRSLLPGNEEGQGQERQPCVVTHAPAPEIAEIGRDRARDREICSTYLNNSMFERLRARVVVWLTMDLNPQRPTRSTGA